MPLDLKIAESVKSPGSVNCRWILRLADSVGVRLSSCRWISRLAVILWVQAPLLAAGSQDSGECKSPGFITCRWISRLADSVGVRLSSRRWISRLAEILWVQAHLFAAGSQDSGECKGPNLVT